MIDAALFEAMGYATFITLIVGFAAFTIYDVICNIK